MKNLVPKKGLEPPHPCEYMDLNHARLPIPPRWHLQQYGGPKSADQEELPYYSTVEIGSLQMRELELISPQEHAYVL